MPVWAVIVLVVGAVVFLAAAAAAAWFGWKAYERRVLLRLVVRTEAVEAMAQALEDTLLRLSELPDEDLEAFAHEPDYSERRVLHEVVSRARMLTDELDAEALPPRLIPVAENLADAAYVIAREAGRVGEGHTGHDALDALAAVDMDAVRGYTAQARRNVNQACFAYGLEDTAVYGGGLYL